MTTDAPKSVNSWRTRSEQLAKEAGADMTGYTTQADEVLAWSMATSILNTQSQNSIVAIGPTGTGAIDCHVTLRHHLNRLQGDGEQVEQLSMQMIRFQQMFRALYHDELYHDGKWYMVTVLVGLEPMPDKEDQTSKS